MTIKDIGRIFLRRKWAFIITFAMVIIAGLLYTFIKTPLYESASQLKLSGLYYNDDILKYFPDEASEIGVYPSNLKGDELAVEVLQSLSRQIEDRELLDEVARRINKGLTGDGIFLSLRTLTDNNNRILIVRISHSDPDIAYEINDLLINTFINNRSGKAEEAIEGLIDRIDMELEGKDIKSDEEGKPDIRSEKIYDDLGAIKYNLINNKDFILNSLVISEEPSIPEKAENVNHIKEIPVILLMSVLAGLIAVFLPDVFLPLKSRNEQ